MLTRINNVTDCGSGSPCNITMPDFVIGRPQCPDINNPTPHSIPRGDNPDGANFVKEAFGLTDEEMVAIMGTVTYIFEIKFNFWSHANI